MWDDVTFTPGDRPVAALRAPLQAVAGHWAAHRGDFVPTRRAFGPETLREVLPYVAILERVEAAPDFRFRLAGTGYLRLFAREVTGLALGDMTAPDLHAALCRALDELVARGEPRGARIACTAGTKRSVLDVLALPLTSDGRVIDQVLLVLDYDGPSALEDGLLARLEDVTVVAGAGIWTALRSGRR